MFNNLRRTVLLFPVFAIVAVGVSIPANAADPPPDGSEERAPLKRMLSIEWRKGPNLPHGFQDSDGGIVEGILISVGGFCSGQAGIRGKEDKYPRGFFDRTWCLALGDPAEEWKAGPQFPGAPRQELFAIDVEGVLYCWGGFSYEKPYCYRDGYRLARRGDTWTWSPLPPLPWPAAGSGIAVIGSKIYVFGGADYNLEAFFTGADRDKNIPRLGARLLAIDTRDLEAGWKELAECPGTPRWIGGMGAVKGALYVIGGASGNDNGGGQYCTVVDNWRYDSGEDAWRRLVDLPVSSGNFPSGRIVFSDRFLILVGGYQYDRVLGPDGALHAAYGKGTKHYAENAYFSDVFVYDTETGDFGTADPLPLNNNLPMVVIQGNTIHLVGGETGGCEIDGETFGHHPDLYLLGTIHAP